MDRINLLKLLNWIRIIVAPIFECLVTTSQTQFFPLEAIFRETKWRERSHIPKEGKNSPKAYLSQANRWLKCMCVTCLAMCCFQKAMLPVWSEYDCFWFELYLLYGGRMVVVAWASVSLKILIIHIAKLLVEKNAIPCIQDYNLKSVLYVANEFLIVCSFFLVAIVLVCSVRKLFSLLFPFPSVTSLDDGIKLSKLLFTISWTVWIS